MTLNLQTAVGKCQRRDSDLTTRMPCHCKATLPCVKCLWFPIYDYEENPLLWTKRDIWKKPGFSWVWHSFYKKKWTRETVRAPHKIKISGHPMFWAMPLSPLFLLLAIMAEKAYRLLLTSLSCSSLCVCISYRVEECETYCESNHLWFTFTSLFSNTLVTVNILH